MISHYIDAKRLIDFQKKKKQKKKVRLAETQRLSTHDYPSNCVALLVAQYPFIANGDSRGEFPWGISQLQRIARPCGGRHDIGGGAQFTAPHISHLYLRFSSKGQLTL